MRGMSAKTRYLRQSPRKVRLVAGLIRGLLVSDALTQLAHVTKAARLPVEKTLRSAVANAENNFQKKQESLFIKEIRIDEGPDIRRWRPRAFGRAAPILKHSCHIFIQLEEREGTGVAHAAHEGADHAEAISGEPTHGTLPPPQEIVDTTRTDWYETAQYANVKDSKKSKGFMKKFFQRKTG